MFSILFLLFPVAICAKPGNVVFFGDSYTDQSRQASINNGTVPGKDYQEIYPPLAYAADGGYAWPWYLSQYGKFTIYNYAVGGAVCSHDLVPVNLQYPDVLDGQTAWFVEDHVNNNTLDMNSDNFTVIVFVGTNDLSVGSFITDDQGWNISLPNIAQCQIDTIQKLYDFGARNFIVNSLIPLQLTHLFSNDSDPSPYYPYEHDGPGWNRRMYNLVNSLNFIVKSDVQGLQLGGADIQYFDTYAFFEQLYNNPTQYFNGSIAPNVTGTCQSANCTEAERDSFMWWDDLHPSEQTDRLLAAEMLKKIEGTSSY